MNFAISLYLNIYSIILLIIIYIHVMKQTDKEYLQHKLFVTILQISIFMLIIDIFSRVEGETNTILPLINNAANFILFLLNPVIPSLWLLYVHYQVYHEWKKAKRWFYFLIAINALNTVMVVISLFFGWLYYIDSKNIYHRGPLFLLPSSLMISLIIVTIALVIVNRKRIEKRYFLSLILFPLLPFVCGILQIIFYGIPFTLNAVALSSLIVFINLQNRNMNIDYLTGAYNRKKLDICMQEKISASTDNKAFSAILIDLDDFKYINDTFGHNMGDYALETSVMLLKNCLKAPDIIARFGGDEFCIILDVSNADDLKKIVDRINMNLKIYNDHSNKLYKLGFSMGYAVYDYHSHMNAEEFQKKIDVLMYKDKRAKKNMKAKIN